MLALSLAFTGCSDKFDDGGYSQVYPGITIYNDGRLTASLAADGVSVAMRLAILMEEMKIAGVTLEVNGAEPNWDDLGTFKFGFDNMKYGKKEFIFGDDDYASITRPADGNYNIEYGSGSDHAFLLIASMPIFDVVSMISSLVE